MNTPIIKLEVQGMAHTIHMALMEHHALMDTSVRKALDAMCTSENIDRLVEHEVRMHMSAAIKDEVRQFFSYTAAGRAAVKEAVGKYLDDWVKEQEEREKWRTSGS